MIKAVLFDCFGVLAVDNWHELLSALPNEEAKTQAKDVSIACDHGYITETELFDQLAGISGRPKDEVAKLLKQNESKNVQLLSLIKELKDQGLKISIISNVGSSWITEELLTKEEANLFNAMTLSYEVGITKPDPRIFHIACEQLGVDRQEALFVDDIADYCSAAEQEGLNAIHYKDFSQTKIQILEQLNHK